jgi:hypothetical protein
MENAPCERNETRALVKVKICVKDNFGMTCQEFYKFISKPRQDALLASSSNNSTYIWN